MKKHWKKIVLVLGLILLSVAGYLVYLFQFKEYEVADEEVTAITRESYEIELPDGSVIIIDEDGNVVEQAAGEGAAGENGGSATGGEGSDSSTGTTDGSGNADGSTDGASGDSDGSTSGSGVAGSTGGTSTDSSGNGSAGGNNGSTSPSGGNGSDGTGSTGSDGGTSGSGGNGSGGSGGNGSGGSDNGSGGKVTVAQIKQKYEPTMANIEDQANGRINNLISRAKAEYTAKQSAGESISYPYFYNKYMGAATDLEERTDSAFYAVLGAMKRELKSNGLAESHADTLVSEYEERKEARKSSILKQAAGF